MSNFRLMSRIARRLLLPAAMFAVLASGCTTDEPMEDAPTPSTAPSAAADIDGRVPGRVTELASGLDIPWGMTFLPDGSALVSGRSSGEVRHVPADGGTATLV